MKTIVGCVMLLLTSDIFGVQLNDYVGYLKELCPYTKFCTFGPTQVRHFIELGSPPIV